MISLQFNIANPWGKRWANVWSKVYHTPHPSKYIELEVFKDTTIVSFMVRLGLRQSHGGLMLEAGLLGYSFSFNFYDIRHWNYDAGRYFKYNEEEGTH